MSHNQFVAFYTFALLLAGFVLGFAAGISTASASQPFTFHEIVSADYPATMRGKDDGEVVSEADMDYLVETLIAAGSGVMFHAEATETPLCVPGRLAAFSLWRDSPKAPWEPVIGLCIEDYSWFTMKHELAHLAQWCKAGRPDDLTKTVPIAEGMATVEALQIVAKSNYAKKEWPAEIDANTVAGMNSVRGVAKIVRTYCVD
jgi:hypothetical protein